MARTRRSYGFTALKVEGGILPPGFLQDIATLSAQDQRNVDYGLSRSFTLKEELARYWRIANDHYADYRESLNRNDLDAEQFGIDEWLKPLFHSILGYDDLTEDSNFKLDDYVFNLTHRACGEAVPFLLTTKKFPLDESDASFGHEGRRQSPHGLMQEYLNATEASLWGIISNGSKLRILRDNPSMTRPAYIEGDLELIFEEQLYSDFATLWLASHASRLKPTDGKPSNCIVEKWRTEAHKKGERARKQLRDGVTQALKQLGEGFLQHKDNECLRGALRDGSLSSARYLEQLLTLVYRLLFLFTAEERKLLHTPGATDDQRDVFEEGYSLDRLRERAQHRRHNDHHGDLWRGLQITFRALAQGEPALGLPALGGLFRSEQCPGLDQAAITNEQFLEAIRALSFFRSEGLLTHINYKDMGTEELGSVYESLLELHPSVNVTNFTFSFSGGENGDKVKGSERKLTGSYYTPSELVSELIKSALEPVLMRAVNDHPENPRKAILDLKVLDPACGSGHFLLAAARRMAAEIMRIESGAGTYDETARRRALREVVQHCIYGVDRNPLAVELCKTALWIETVEPGKPLTFLDSHIQLGDSLVGIIDPKIMDSGIPDDAYKPLRGDDKRICRILKKQNGKAGNFMQDSLSDKGEVYKLSTIAGLEHMPEATLHDVELKDEAWKRYRRDENRMHEELRANLFVGAYFARKTQDNYSTIPCTEDLNRLGLNRFRRQDVEEAATKLARRHRFFHWHIDFAEIMQRGGFDVVLGNPPWERIKLQEKEFFASRSPEIADAPKKADRGRLIKRLTRDDASEAEKVIFNDFQIAKRESEAASQFTRTGRRFPLTGVGDINTYALFAETFLNLVSPAGRAGLIVPTGIATGEKMKDFFSHLVANKRIVSLYDFENKELFPGVHSSFKFCLLTLSGRDNPVPEAEFAFYLHRPEQLGEDERRLVLSAEDFSLFNPDTLTCSTFRTRRDMEIARKMYQRAGVFCRKTAGGKSEENPWGATFQRMFDMSNDSDLFRTHEQLTEEGWELRGNVFSRSEECYLPLYEAKLFDQYDHRFATYDGVSDQNRKKVNTRQIGSREKADPETLIIPWYWVHEDEVRKKLDRSGIPGTLVQAKRGGGYDYQHTRRVGSQLALRCISRATDKRTGIVAMTPFTAMGNSAMIIMVGSSPSGMSRAPQTNERQLPPFCGGVQ